MALRSLGIGALLLLLAAAPAPPSAPPSLPAGGRGRKQPKPLREVVHLERYGRPFE